MSSNQHHTDEGELFVNDDYQRGSFEGKVLAELQAIHAKVNELNFQYTALGARLLTLEVEGGRIKGMSVILGAIAGLLGGVVLKFLKLN